MIYVRKWEKKKKEMSTKNNIFFNTYLDSRVFFNAIIFAEVKQLEEQNMANEIEALRELLRLRAEEEARLLAEANKQTEANSDASDVLTVVNLVPDVVVEDSNTSQVDVGVRGEDDAATEITQETGLPAEELPTEDSIRSKYFIKIKGLMSTNVNLIYNSYEGLFSGFDFEGKMRTLVEDSESHEELFEDRAVNTNFLIKNFSKFYNFSPTDNSSVFPNLFLFFWRLRLSNSRIFEKTTKFKINKLKLKKKKKLRKIYIIKKMKKTTFFRKIRRKFFANFHTTLALSIKFSTTNSNILVRRMPVSQRVIETTNVEFFYKLNKYTKVDLTTGNFDYFDESFDDSDDFLIYLRNYHQKPYLKLRKARIAH